MSGNDTPAAQDAYRKAWLALRYNHEDWDGITWSDHNRNNAPTEDMIRTMCRILRDMDGGNATQAFLLRTYAGKGRDHAKRAIARLERHGLVYRMDDGLLVYGEYADDWLDDKEVQKELI